MDDSQDVSVNSLDEQEMAGSSSDLSLTEEPQLIWSEDITVKIALKGKRSWVWDHFGCLHNKKTFLEGEVSIILEYF